MKKILYFVFLLFFVFAFAAVSCDSDDDIVNTEKEEPTPVDPDEPDNTDPDEPDNTDPDPDPEPDPEPDPDPDPEPDPEPDPDDPNAVKVANLAGSGSFTIWSFADEDSPVSELSALTIELTAYPVALTNSISTLFGCEENFVLRFGNGAGNDSDELEIVAKIGEESEPDNKTSYSADNLYTASTETWYHFAVVYDGTNVYVYVDGEQVSSTAVTGGGTVNLSMSLNADSGYTWTDAFAIGRSAGHDRYLNGYVGECRVWSIARSAEDLKSGWTSSSFNYKTTGLVAAWRFDGSTDSDGNVSDLTGNGHTATAETVTYVSVSGYPY